MGAQKENFEFLNFFLKMFSSNFWIFLLLFLFFAKCSPIWLISGPLQNWDTCTSFRKGIQILKFHTIEKYINFLFFILFYVFFYSLNWLCWEFPLVVNRFPLSLKDSEINSQRKWPKSAKFQNLNIFHPITSFSL